MNSDTHGGEPDATVTQRKRGRPRELSDEAVREMVRLLDGEQPTVSSLAIIAGQDRGAVGKRIREVRAAINYAGPTAPAELDAEDREYLRRRYADSKDPAVVEWLASLGNLPSRRP